MDKAKYSQKCQILTFFPRERQKVEPIERWFTFQCESLAQPLSILMGPFAEDNAIRIAYDQFDWQVWFYTSGQPKRTDMEEKVVEFGKEGILPILVKATGLVVGILPDPGNPGDNLLVVDVSSQKPFFITCLNRDLSLGVGDWVELEERFMGVTNVQTSVIGHAEILAKFPKEGRQS